MLQEIDSQSLRARQIYYWLLEKGEHCTVNEIGHQCGMQVSHRATQWAYASVQKLVAAGLVRKNLHGMYCAPDNIRG